MKKIFLTGTLLVLLINLQGCKIKDKVEQITQDAINSYENIAEEAKNVVEEVKETKEKAEETINDIENAADKINEATDAVKEITE